MRKFLYAMLLITAVSTAFTATLNVPGSYSTISAAVTAASAGDTIKVAPGTILNEEVVINKDSIAIIGEPGDVLPGPAVNAPIMDGTGLSGKSAFKLTAGAHDITIAGFEIRNYGPDNNTGANGVVAWSSTPIYNITITDNYFHHLGWDMVLVGNEGQCVHYGWTVKSNILDNYFAYGLELTNTGNSVITQNHITGTPACWSGIGVFVYDYPGGGNYNVLVGNIDITLNTVKDVIAGKGIRLLAWENDDPSTVSLSNINIKGNTVTNCNNGVHVWEVNAGASISNVVVNYNNLKGNISKNLTDYTAAQVNAQKNWWGSIMGPASGAVSGSPDTSNWLKTDKVNLAMAGARLAETQYTVPGQYFGGWGWDLVAPPTYENIHGPITIGLARAYRASQDPVLYTALQNAKTFLLSHTLFNSCSGSSAVELDRIFGGTACVDYVKANFYDKLKAGTYVGSSGPHTYASFLQSIYNWGSGSYINLRAWDIGLHLASAHAVGEDINPWLEGLKVGIDSMDSSKYNITLALSGAIIGLKSVDMDYTATSGSYAGLNRAGLITALVALQQPNGSFEEDPQCTAYAVMAMSASGVPSNIILKSIEYLKSSQFANGGSGFEDSPGNWVENNECTAEMASALSLVDLISLTMDHQYLFIKPGESVLLSENVSNLTQKVDGIDSIMNFSSIFFNSGPTDVSVTPGGGNWDTLIYGVWNTGGDLDVSVGVKQTLIGGTDDNANAAKVALQSKTGVEGVTRVVFRPTLNDTEWTTYTYNSGLELPANVWDSQTIYIDGTAPVVNTFTVAPTCTNTTSTITFDASDNLSGIDHVDVFVDGILTASNVSSPYVLDVSLYPHGAYSVQVKAYDRSGNATLSVPITVNVDKTAPTITAGSLSLTCVKDQNVDVVGASATDTGCAGVNASSWEHRVNGGAWVSGLSILNSELVENANLIEIQVMDNLGNWSSAYTAGTVYKDTTAPVITTATASPACVGIGETVTISASYSDTGCAGGTVVWEHKVGTGSWVSGLTVSDTELTYGANTLYVRATDGNGNVSSTYTVSPVVEFDNAAPVISNITAVQGSANVLCPNNAVQGVVDIYVDATDPGCAGLAGAPTVTVTGITPVTYIGVVGNTYHYQVSVLPGTANGSHTITVSATDNNGNTATDNSQSICVDKNQITGTVSFDTESTILYTFNRAVTFVATDSSNNVIKTWTVTLSFSNSVSKVASATYTLLNVPGNIANLSAKTNWHLRKKNSVVLDGDGQAVSNFVLLGGDLNNTNTINILDYGVLKGNWGAGTVGDVNGDGVSNLLDYSIMKANWFLIGDDN